MENTASLNHSMNSAKKHYSSMFFLPSHKKALLSIAVITIAAVGISTLVLFQTMPINSLLLGITLFTVTLLGDLILSKLILKVDPIYLLRRTLALSFYGWVLWFSFILLGAILGYAFDWLLWVKFCLIGWAAVITLRLLVFVATSTASLSRKVLAALFQPSLCIMVFLAFWISIPLVYLTEVSTFIIIAPILGGIAIYLLISSLNHLGKKEFKMPSMPLFRAFMLNWVVGLNAPLESFLEQMGENADIEVSILKFTSSKPKAAVIVPNVHPGPFKNIGSSLLPSLLKHGFDEAYDCHSCIPLGILGHELDLASQAQNHKIVSEVIAAAKFDATIQTATPVVKVSEGHATAYCQIFGDTALVSFTVAPKTTEDLPQELGRVVREEAERHGLKSAIVINAHNSINDIIDTDAYIAELEKAASTCIQKAVILERKPFKVGAASVYPKDFTLKQGMGTGGITAVVIKVENQKAVYVVIDGNNMISGFREKILYELAALGFDESEVLTTDTHAVSALVTGRRGYHPVGEVMDQNLLIKHIGEAAKAAEANLEATRAGYLRLVVQQVRVIGEARLHSMTQLVDKAVQKTKRIVVPIFGIEGLILLLLLTLF